MRPASRLGCAAGLFLAAASVTRSAHAGNDEGLLLGNQAAMTGGAVTATVSEGSAIWYNPAGIAAVPSESLDLSASAYGVRFYSAPRLLDADNGASAPVNVTEFVIVPTALAYVRPIGHDLRIAGGLFAPRANDLILRADLDAGPDGRWLVTQASFDRITYGGASLGWAATKALRLGISLLASYRFEQTELQFAGGNPSGQTEPVAFTTSSLVVTQTTLGGLVSIGAQWELTPEWTLGWSLRSPAVNFYVNRNSNSFATAASPSPMGVVAAYEPDTNVVNRSDFAFTRPVQMRLGVARTWPSGWVTLDGDLSPALSKSDPPQDVKFNVRLGGMVALAEMVMVGLGVFTDRDGNARNEFNGETPRHFYGASAGARWGKRYDVEGDDKPEVFDFTTTLGLRYAYGHGDLGNLRVSISDIDGSPVPTGTTGETQITVHEIMLHLGAGFYF